MRFKPLIINWYHLLAMSCSRQPAIRPGPVPLAQVLGRRSQSTNSVCLLSTSSFSREKQTFFAGLMHKAM
jgi:hypothetical protein